MLRVHAHTKTRSFANLRFSVAAVVRSHSRKMFRFDMANSVQVHGEDVDSGAGDQHKEEGQVHDVPQSEEPFIEL